MLRYAVLMILLAAPWLDAGASEIMTNLARSYQDATSGWHDVIFPYAQGLFASLAALQFIWCVIRWILAGDGVERIVANLLVFMVGIGLFYAILLNFHVWMPQVIASFAMIGAEASTVPVLDPSGIVDVGLDIALAMLDRLTALGVIFDPSSGLLTVLVSVLIVLSFTAIAGQLLVGLIESYVVLSGGVLLLGFAGSSWTMGIASRLLGYGLSVGIKLFVLYLIIGIGASLATAWQPLIEAAGIDNLSAYYEVLIGALLFAAVSWNIPSMAASLVTGGVNMTLGNTTQTALLTGAGVAAGIGGAVGLLGKSVTQLTRATQDLTAATKHGVAVGQGTGSVARGIGAGVGSLAQEAVRSARYMAQGGRHNRVASNIGRRTAMFRNNNPPPSGGLGGVHRPRRAHRNPIREAAHNIPRDEANGQGAEVKINLSDD